MINYDNDNDDDDDKRIVTSLGFEMRGGSSGVSFGPKPGSLSVIRIDRQTTWCSGGF